MPQDRVERVDELAARRDEAHAPARVPVALAFDAAPRRPLPQARAPIRPRASGDAEPPRAAIEERQVEAVQVVVLDDVGIGGANSCHQPPNQLRLGLVARPLGLEHLDRA